jgi:7-carboxy-7-deazaguanine synthase
MSYVVKEVFYTLQGEGAHSGRPAVFCRFAGCNLWSGRDEERAQAICRFCDTDFVGTNGLNGGVYSIAEDLAVVVESCWPEPVADAFLGNRFVVCTGGEPLLQVDAALVDALHARGFRVAVETNGTKLPPPGIDWICVSPKANAPLVLRGGDELKLVFPQVGVDPADYASLDFGRHFLQPMDGPLQEENARLAARYCLEHPQWELSLQLHKLLGLP